MDTLSDVLRVVRLDGAFFFAVEAVDPWSVDTAPARELTPRILPSAQHLISYHILTGGRCFGGVRGEEQVELLAGDVIVFPHGDAHVMSSGRDLRLGPEVNTATSARFPDTVHLGAQGSPGASFVCGFLGCDARPFNPLLAALPHRLHVRGMSGAWLATFTRQLTEESRLGRPGSDTVLTRLAELMFIEVLRRYLEDLPQGQTGWLAGLRDEMVGRVLALLHARPGHPWTLDELAREVASSRSNVAKRFTELVGQPPMQYLTHWRMQVAANRLAQSGAKVATIAREVGYDSEAAFSRAFKKVTGVAPGGWRHSRTEGRKDGRTEGQKDGGTGVIPSEARDLVRE
jgi:AraC-like DNA-binding protein